MTTARGEPKTKAEARKHFESGADASDSGAAAGAGVTEASNKAAYKTTTLNFTDTPIVMADNAGTIAYGSLKIFDFPAGHIDIAGAVIDLALTKSSAGINDTWDGDVSLGTAAANNSATLTGTEADIIASTATPQAVSGATTAKAASSAGVQFDGSGTAVDVFINFVIDDTDHDITATPANLICNGTVQITWCNLGDK